MPRHTLAEISDRTVILNYCMCDEKSDTALFPIGTTGMMNHGGINANVKIEWFEWPAPPGDARRENRLTWLLKSWRDCILLPNMWPLETSRPERS
jgi:hypothetical protein